MTSTAPIRGCSPACVLHVDLVDGGGDEAIERVGHGRGLTGEREDTAVVARVARPVEEVHPRHGAGSRRRAVRPRRAGGPRSRWARIRRGGSPPYRATSGPPRGTSRRSRDAIRPRRRAQGAGVTPRVSTSRQIETPSTASGGRPNRSVKNAIIPFVRSIGPTMTSVIPFARMSVSPARGRRRARRPPRRWARPGSTA